MPFENTVPSMTISTGDSVTIEYTGRLDDGTVFDTSYKDLAGEMGLLEEHPNRDFTPLTVEVGDDAVIPGLEEALIGMEVGEKKRISIPPEKGYGEYSDDRVAEYPRDDFEEMLGEIELAEGVEVQTDEGLPGLVTDVGPETVTVDFNHELAGETLEFDIEIVEVN